jgi:hypothetical protein
MITVFRVTVGRGCVVHQSFRRYRNVGMLEQMLKRHGATMIGPWEWYGREKDGTVIYFRRTK